jgi:hypothetical protein
MKFIRFILAKCRRRRLVDLDAKQRFIYLAVKR